MLASFGAGFEPIFGRADVWLVDMIKAWGLLTWRHRFFPFKDRSAELPERLTIFSRFTRFCAFATVSAGLQGDADDASELRHGRKLRHLALG